MTKTALDFGDEDDPKRFNEMVLRYYAGTLNALAQNYSVNISQPTYTNVSGTFPQTPSTFPQSTTGTQAVTWTWTTGS